MRCPVCKAITDQGELCRRCRADLALLVRLEEQRDHHLVEARQALSRGKLGEALAAAEQAHQWRADVESRRLLAVVHLLRRDFARAWHDYQSIAHQAESACANGS